MEPNQTKPSWHEILGCNNWEGLLEPLDLTLRTFILRCGNFCQASYDAFNNDNNSKYAGSSRYGKKSFFKKVMLESSSDYQVASFLYGTAKISRLENFFLHSLSRESWDRESNWIGYVATTTDEVTRVLGRREIYVVWRGTITNYEWITDSEAKKRSWERLSRPKTWAMTKDDHDHDHPSSDTDEEPEEGWRRKPKVMHGWLTIYSSSDPNSPFTRLSARKQLLRSIKTLVEKYKEEKLSIISTGHSLGGSLSILSAFDLAENGIKDIPISVFAFSSPQVGNKAFNDRLNQFSNIKILHIRNKIDLIPHYPSHLLGYVSNLGETLKIDTRKSPSLKESKNPFDWHNLEATLHVVAGWNGEHGPFEMKAARSLALVNKSSSFLREECLVPGSWWTERNKGMKIDDDGMWVLAPPAEEDLPTPELLSTNY